MRPLIISSLLLLSCFSASIAQSDKESLGFFRNADSLHKKRLIGVCVFQGAVWGSSMYALNKAWYANYPRSSFQFFNDVGEWNQVDKVGHGWSAYWGAQLSSNLFRWAGVPRKRAALYGFGMGIAYVSVIEILDGYSAEWGFSAADMAANTGGALFFASQEWLWEEQRIQFKFSAHKNYYRDPMLKQRANDLYGRSLAERILKDYNGQTYWLSANLHSFAKESKLPKWLNVAVGYGATGIFGGFENTWKNEDGSTQTRYDIRRVRQFYLAPDIDLSKVSINGKTPKLFRLLNGLKLKFPMPAIEFNTAGGVRLHPLFF